MKIVDLIRREMVAPDLVSVDKKAILVELANHVAKFAPAPGGRPQFDAATVARVLADREQLASTAVGEGVAIPHGKLASVTEIVACLGRSRAGVSFGSMDGEPTYLFFVLIAPEASTGSHLKALARISRVFKDPDFRARLLAADGAEAMYQVVADEDSRY